MVRGGWVRMVGGGGLCELGVRGWLVCGVCLFCGVFSKEECVLLLFCFNGGIYILVVLTYVMGLLCR